MQPETVYVAEWPTHMLAALIARETEGTQVEEIWDLKSPAVRNREINARDRFILL